MHFHVLLQVLHHVALSLHFDDLVLILVLVLPIAVALHHDELSLDWPFGPNARTHVVGHDFLTVGPPSNRDARVSLSHISALITRH
jgi:hypothetical protein